MGKIIDKEDNVIEFEINDEEIDKLINGLKTVKETKSHLHFNIDEDNSLLIHHEEDELK